MFGISISSVSILPLRPQGGLCGFGSCILNEAYYLGALAIYTSPGSKHGFRVVFPNKRLASGKTVEIFHPLSQEAGAIIEEAIVKEYARIMDNFQHVS